MWRTSILLLYFLLPGHLISQVPPKPFGASATNSSVAANESFAEKRAPLKHLLSPGDTIEIKVYQETDLNSRTVVDNEGYIHLPLLERVQVGGKTTEETITLIRELLQKDYLHNPQVSVTLLDMAKGHFSVLGQVQKPERYEIAPNQKINLLEAIATAGGFNRLANQKRVIVKRTSVDNKEEQHTLNAADMAKNRNAKPFEIKPGDTIIVGESRF